MSEPMRRRPPHYNRQYDACYDCGRRYGDEFGFPDLVVPHEIWNGVLSPTSDEGGLLCPSCMVRRAHAAGITCRAEFTSGPFASSPSGSGGPDEAKRLKHLLDDARRGLQWWMDMHPGEVSSADYEKMDEIREAIGSYEP